MSLQWTNELSVNVGEIDDQHQEIFRRYNAFLTACKNAAGREKIPELVDFLVDYVASHFAHEEKMMVQYNYPAKDEHMGEHLKFRNIVHASKERLNEEGPALSLVTEINQTLFNWLVKHIKKTDTEFGAFLNNKWGLF